MKLDTTKKITYTSLMMALVFVGTFIIKIPTIKGYIHLGDAFVLLSGLLLGPSYGTLAAGVGSMLSDLIAGYPQWAVPTLIIKGLMAAILGILVTKKDNKKVIFSVGLLFSVIWIGFNFALRYILKANVSDSSSDLVESLELSNANELISMSKNIQNNLLLVALLLPAVLFILVLIFNRLKLFRFSGAYSLGYVISGSIMVILYYITESILYGNYVVAIFSVPTNLLQFIAGIVIIHLLTPVVLNTKIINTHK